MEDAFRAMADARPDAILVSNELLFFLNRRRVVELAGMLGRQAMYSARELSASTAPAGVCKRPLRIRTSTIGSNSLLARGLTDP